MIHPPIHQRAVDRRKHRFFAVRFPERRSGFDRRRTRAYLLALRDNPARLLGVLALLNLMNLADFLLTQYELALGTVAEGNPLMALAFGMGGSAALMTKVGGMLLITVVVWQLRRFMRILDLALAAMVFYAVVIAYHLVGLAFWA